jgi:hypothetical protein
MQRETGGGSFAADDLPQLRAALAAGDLDGLYTLALAEPDGGAIVRSYALRWWACQECLREAFVTCVAMSSSNVSIGSPVEAMPLHGDRVRALRDLIRYRRDLADRERSHHDYHR